MKSRIVVAVLAMTLNLWANGAALAQPLSLSFSDGNPTARALILGGTQVVMFDVVAGADFPAARVNLSIGRALELSALDPRADVEAVVSPEFVDLQPGQTARVQVTLSAKVESPDFAAKPLFMLNAISPDAQAVSQLAISLQVDPILEIRLYGGAADAETWSLPSSVSLRKHVGGVLLRYVNYDAADGHIIHGQGAIPHASTSKPLLPSQNGLPGGVYEVRITNQNAVTGQYYCHLHEGAAASVKTIRFNAVQ